MTRAHGPLGQRHLVVGVGVAFVAGMIVRGLLTPAAIPPTTQSRTHASTTVSLAATAKPPRSSEGASVGSANTAAGARAAAVAYVLTGQRFLDLAPTQVTDAVRAIAAAETVDAQIAQALQQLAALRTALAAGTGPIRYEQAILATDVEMSGARRVRVAVWNVGVLWRVGVAQPQAGWHVSTIELVWEHGDWKILSETITPGPAPASAATASPVTAEQFDRALTGFTSWPDRP